MIRQAIISSLVTGAVAGVAIELERTREETDETRRVRYSADPIADDPDAFTDYVLERRGVELTDPSDARELESDTDGRISYLRYDGEWHRVGVDEFAV